MTKLNPHPETQSIPENRHGTKTYRGYMKHMVGGNYVSGNVERIMVRATNRQNKKARRLVEAGTFGSEVEGRILRQLVRACWVDYDDSVMAGGW